MDEERKQLAAEQRALRTRLEKVEYHKREQTGELSADRAG
jgi:hypothetical protein